AVTFTVGVAGSFTVTANGSPTPMLGMSGSLPSGVSFNAVTGVLSGTPVAGSGGSYPLVFTASNGVGADAMQNFTLTVNQAPVISSAASATFPIGTPNSFTVTSSGFPTPAVSETGALPGGITFVDNGDGTAALAGTPQPGSAGTWPLSIKAANGVASDALQSFTLTVSCPVITVSGTLPDGLYQTAYGAQTFTQTGSAGAPVWTATGLPAGLVIGAADGIVSGSPTTTTNGVTVAVTATDANQCTGTLAINNFKVLPVAGNDAYATFGNTQLYVATATPATPYVGSATLITANDAGPAPIVAAILAAPAHGTLTSFVGGGFIFTPTAGYSGNDSFTYTITDGNGVMSSPATVAISLGQVVWYVNGAAGAGDGRSATPFNSLVAASAAHAAGDAIFVESAVAPTTTPGAITLKANTTLWGQGVALPLAISNTGATSKPKLTGTVTLGGNGVTISSLDINTAATIGLTNAGSLTGAIVKNDVTIATTSAAALSLSNVTASTLTFRRIDAGTAATGPVNGIVLNKTSALTVLGDGTTSTCNSGNTACSGGIIQHTSGDAISLTAAGATLSSMWIKNNVNSGIKGQGVPKLVLADLLVQNNTNNTGEQAGILINELSDPAATATRIEVSGSTEDNVRIHNSSVAGAIVIDASTVIDNSAASGNQGVFFQTNTTGNLTGTVKNSFLHGNRTIALRGDAGDGSTLSATFTGNTITAGVVNQGNQGIEVTRAVTSALTFNVANNAVSGLPSTLINVFSSGGPGTATGDVKNNTVSGVGVGGNQVGIRLFNSGSDLAGYATMNVNVANNTVSAIDNAYAILGESSQPGTSVNPGGALKIAVTGNTANVAAGGTALDAIRVQSRVKSTVCARISGNTSGGGGGGFYGLQLRQANTALYNLEGLTAGPQTDPTVFNYVVAQNPAVATVGPTIGTITGVATNSCGITP
ncbi:MAG: putative Ig domain-containing protein, partial [Dokdonella sp.]